MMLTLCGYVAHYILGGLCHTKSTFHVDFECGVYILFLQSDAMASLFFFVFFTAHFSRANIQGWLLLEGGVYYFWGKLEDINDGYIRYVERVPQLLASAVTKCGQCRNTVHMQYLQKLVCRKGNAQS